MLTESRCDGLCRIALLGQTAAYRTGHHRLHQRPIVKPLRTPDTQSCVMMVAKEGLEPPTPGL